MLMFQHAPFDAMVVVALCSYIDQKVVESEGRWKVCKNYILNSLSVNAPCSVEISTGFFPSFFF